MPENRNAAQAGTRRGAIVSSSVRPYKPAKVESIVEALNAAGIVLRDHRPSSYRAACPRCDRGPRDSALGITIEPDGGALWHCFRCGHAGSWRPSGERIERSASIDRAPDPQPDDSERRRDKALWLWRQRRPIADTPAEKYLRRRGYNGEPPATMGFLSTRGEHPSALISCFAIPTEPEPGPLHVADAAVRGVHIIRLTESGQKAPVEPVKLMVGPSLGTPIVLAPMNDLLGLIVCEGVETGLSLFEATGCGVWAAGAAGRMAALADAVPDYADCVTVAAEADPAGIEGARNLVDVLRACGLHVETRTLGGSE